MKHHFRLMVALFAMCSVEIPVMAQTNAFVQAAKGDLDGDGYGDFIIQHQDTGYVAALGLVSNDVVWAGYLGGGFDVRPLRLVGTLDLDADGIEDILWRYGDSDRYIWSTMDQTNVVATDNLLDEETFDGWDVLATADFDNDENGDLLVRHREAKVWAIAYLADFELIGVDFVDGIDEFADWNVAGAGDIDGDEYPDLVIENKKTGHVVIVWMEDEAVVDTSPIYGSDTESLFPWRVAGVTDVDGTGQVAFILQLGKTSYYEINRPVLVGDAWEFTNEALGGFTSGIGDWRVIGSR